MTRFALTALAMLIIYLAMQAGPLVADALRCAADVEACAVVTSANSFGN